MIVKKFSTRCQLSGDLVRSLSFHRLYAPKPCANFFSSFCANLTSPAPACSSMRLKKPSCANFFFPWASLFVPQHFFFPGLLFSYLSDERKSRRAKKRSLYFMSPPLPSFLNTKKNNTWPKMTQISQAKVKIVVNKN